METNILLALSIATILGALVGFEREISNESASGKNHDAHFGGVRSYALICLL